MKQTQPAHMALVFARTPARRCVSLAMASCPQVNEYDLSVVEDPVGTGPWLYSSIPLVPVKLLSGDGYLFVSRKHVDPLGLRRLVRDHPWLGPAHGEFLRISCSWGWNLDGSFWVDGGGCHHFAPGHGQSGGAQRLVVSADAQEHRLRLAEIQPHYTY